MNSPATENELLMGARVATATAAGVAPLPLDASVCPHPANNARADRPPATTPSVRFRMNVIHFLMASRLSHLRDVAQPSSRSTTQPGTESKSRTPGKQPVCYRDGGGRRQRCRYWRRRCSQVGATGATTKRWLLSHPSRQIRMAASQKRTGDGAVVGDSNFAPLTHSLEAVEAWGWLCPYTATLACSAKLNTNPHASISSKRQ